MWDKLFLRILKSALMGERFVCDTPIPSEGWEHICRLAQEHKVLPLVYDAVYDDPSFREFQPEGIRSAVRLMTMQQVNRTSNFLSVYKSLCDSHFAPIVVKGIVCRQLYPKPDLRQSSDEDLLVPPKDFPRYSEILTELGLISAKPGEYQTSFVRSDGLYLELHSSLFSVASDYFNSWNRLFQDSAHRTEVITVDSVSVRTLSPDDHLLYLILHALKHFLHSGTGIRQICDIVMFANCYGKDINWEKLFSDCKSLNAEKFAAAIFAIGSKYLNFDPKVACYPAKWQKVNPDPEPMLADILGAGVYGSSSMSRRHSSSITLDAVQGNSTRITRRLFPPAKQLNKKYSYATKSPLLLPVAWSHRLLSYGMETKGRKDNSPSASLRIGKERLALLDLYGLLNSK